MISLPGLRSLYLVIQSDNAAATGGVDLVGEILVGLEADRADRGTASRERIDITYLDCVVRQRRNGDKTKCQRDAGHVESHCVLPGRRVPARHFRRLTICRPVRLSSQ